MEKKITLPEDKYRRIAVGATIAGVLLVLFLVAVLIVQFVQIGARNARSRELSRQIEEYEQMIEEGEKNLEFYESYLGRQRLAIEHHWSSPPLSSENQG